MLDIDRGAVCIRLRRRTNDYIRYIRETLQVSDIFDENETMSHLTWLTIGTPAPRLYTDEDLSVSTIATSTAGSGVNDPEEIPKT